MTLATYIFISLVIFNAELKLDPGFRMCCETALDYMENNWGIGHKAGAFILLGLVLASHTLAYTILPIWVIYMSLGLTVINFTVRMYILSKA